MLDDVGSPIPGNVVRVSEQTQRAQEDRRPRDPVAQEVRTPPRLPSVPRAREALMSSPLRLSLETRQLVGSRQVALEVVKLLREVVASAKFNSFEHLIAHVEEVGKVLQDAGPKGGVSLSLRDTSRRLFGL